MKLTHIPIILAIMLPSIAFGQCSDAGICSIAGLFSEDTATDKFMIGVSYNYAEGSASDDVSFSTINIKGKYFFSEKTSFTFNLPFVRQSGPLGTVSGLGDIIILGTQNLFTKPDRALDLELGLKLATGDENKDDSLPLVYQTGLGTTDVLIGLSCRRGNFKTTLGYQWVPRIYNDNALTPLKRGDDIYLQTAYTWDLSDWNLTVNLLAIQRLQESEIEGSGTVDDSAQLQINVGGSAAYKLSEKHTLTADLASPLLKRDVNVDGLTRSISLSLSWQMIF